MKHVCLQVMQGSNFTVSVTNIKENTAVGDKCNCPWSSQPVKAASALGSKGRHVVKLVLCREAYSLFKQLWRTYLNSPSSDVKAARLIPGRCTPPAVVRPPQEIQHHIARKAAPLVCAFVVNVTLCLGLGFGPHGLVHKFRQFTSLDKFHIVTVIPLKVLCAKILKMPDWQCISCWGHCQTRLASFRNAGARWQK